MNDTDLLAAMKTHNDQLDDQLASLDKEIARLEARCFDLTIPKKDRTAAAIRHGKLTNDRYALRALYL